MEVCKLMQKKLRIGLTSIMSKIRNDEMSFWTVCNVFNSSKIFMLWDKGILCQNTKISAADLKAGQTILWLFKWKSYNVDAKS